MSLQRSGQIDEAEATFRELVRLNPKRFLFLFNFHQCLRSNGKVEEARSVANRIAAPFCDRLRHDPHNRSAQRELRVVSWIIGDFAAAINVIREVAQTFPNDAYLHQLTGQILLLQKDWPGAIAAYREAIRIKPLDVDPRYHLASALGLSGDREGVIVELREALRVERIPQHPTDTTVVVGTNSVPPAQKKQGGDEAVIIEEPEFNEDAFEAEADNAFIHGLLIGSSSFFKSTLHLERGQLALGTALAESGDLRGAIAEYKTVRLGDAGMEGKAMSQFYLGSATRLEGDLASGIAAYREAIRLGLGPEPEIEARYSLGIALAESGDPKRAIIEFHEAIRQEGLDRVGPFRLLRAILMGQRSEDAVRALRRVREQARDDRAVLAGIDLAMAQFEQLSESGTPVQRIFRMPVASGGLAERYYNRRFFIGSAAIWSAGFAADPKLADDMDAHNRYNAACSAALASAGNGLDKPPLDDEAKARWRKQALDWLKADLAHWAKHAESGATDAKSHVCETLQHWKADRDLASVRDEADVKKLPEQERKAWHAFWAEVAALLKKTGES